MMPTAETASRPVPLLMKGITASHQRQPLLDEVPSAAASKSSKSLVPCVATGDAHSLESGIDSIKSSVHCIAGREVRDVESTTASNILFRDLEDAMSYTRSGAEDTKTDLHSTLGCLKSGSTASSVWLLSSMSLGVGIFVQPGVVSTIGWALGGILILGFGLITNYSQWLLLMVRGPGSSCSSSSKLALRELGKPGLVLQCGALGLSCLIANAAHMSTVSQMLHDILSWYFVGTYDHPFPASKRAIVIGFLLAFVMPFCFAKQLRSLRHISTISVLTCIILAMTMAILAIRQIIFEGVVSGAKAVPAFVWDIEAVLSGGAAICFAYSSIANLMLVSHEMRPPPATVAAAFIPVSISSALCCVLYVSVAILCVLAWGTDTCTGSGNVLYLESANDYWATFWCFVLVVAITLLYPVINFPVVTECETVVALLVTSEVPNTPACDKRLKNLKQGRGWTASALRYQRETISVAGMGLVIILDSCVQDLASLFGLCGSLGLSTMTMIIPGVMFLHSPRCRKHGLLHIAGACVVTLVGLALMFASTSVIIKGLLS